MADVQWYEKITEERARRILGSEFFDRLVADGPGACNGRAYGAWLCNNAENHAAYAVAHSHAVEAHKRAQG